MENVHEKSFDAMRAKYKKLKAEYQNGDISPERLPDYLKELNALDAELKEFESKEGILYSNKNNSFMKTELKEVEFKFNSIQDLESFLSYLRSEERLASVSHTNVNEICDADYQNWRDGFKK